MDRSLATKERPLLNQGIPYQSEANRTQEDDSEITYDTSSALSKRTHLTQIEFTRIYRDIIRYFTVQEKFQFAQYQSGERGQKEFYDECLRYIKKIHPQVAESKNDLEVMLERIHLAVFQYDVLQPLIDNPETSDIKVCRYDDIRVRVKGKAYKSNANFLDEGDMYRFINGLAVRNGVDIMGSPLITFTDNHDENYKMRFTVSSPMVTCDGLPYLHIRKVAKKKKNFDELILDGMLNADVKQYIIDRMKLAKGIVFAGPPGSGKTTALNAAIEYIPKTRETLVIQENDELFTEQSGFMFKHVTHGFKRGEPIVTLSDLGRMALVEGCNEFIIGEVKGGEMRDAMTLVNAGGNIALTVHSTNAYETLDKLADLVKYGSDYSFEEARMMLKTIDTIVYMEGYKIREILECRGYDRENHTYLYDYIYRYDPDAYTPDSPKEVPENLPEQTII